MTKIVEMEYWNDSWELDSTDIIFKCKDGIKTRLWFGNAEIYNRFGDERPESKYYFLELKGTTILDFVSAEGLK